MTRQEKKQKETIISNVEIFPWQSWQPTEKAVLCFIIQGEEVLLIHKKTGLGAGKINAPGGRIEALESPLQAAIRETEEETGLTPQNPMQVADLSFVFTNGYSLHTSVFLAHGFRGEAYETREALPIWINRSQLPFSEMWQDDPYWVPYIFQNKFVTGYFIFEEDTLLSHKTTVSSL